jgi:TM2 domain-containing membrane protein YozV
MSQSGDAIATNTVQCSTCGADIHDRAEICPECGTRQRAPPEASEEDNTSLLSAVASVPVPGLGQMINRQFGRGLAFMIAFYGGYFFLNTTFGGALNFILFGIWGYAIYDAYTGPSDTSSSPSKWTDWLYTIYDASLTGGQSGDFEGDQRTGGAGATGNPGRNPTVNDSGSTAAGTSEATRTNPNMSNRDHRNPPTQPSTADVTSDRPQTVDGTVTDSGGTAERTATNDDIAGVDDGDPSDGHEEFSDDDDDSESKWSRDESERSWSRE